MGFSGAAGATRFALGSGLRAAVIGLLVSGATLAAVHHYWATAAVAGIAAVIVIVELGRSARSADRLIASFVDSLGSEVDERPISHPALSDTAAAIDKVLHRQAAIRAERQRRSDHLQAVVDNVAAALVVLDEAGEVIELNRAARQRLGLRKGPLSEADMLPPQVRTRLRALSPGAREIVRLSDERAMLAQVAAFTAGGQRVRLISLQSLAGELDAVELKAWRDLGRVLSHEIMNSLTPICSLSESLSAKLDDAGEGAAALSADLEVIARRSAGLMRFVTRYRTLNDLPEPEPVRIEASELVERLDHLMRPMMVARGVDYASSIEPRRLVLMADPDLVEQALINLLKNALEAVEGRPDAAVRLGCRLGDGRPVFIVEDNGPGLPRCEPEEIFVPFFTTKAGGMGVGLTLARQVALMHGGRLEHAAREPGGAIFRLHLGAAQGDGQDGAGR